MNPKTLPSGSLTRRFVASHFVIAWNAWCRHDGEVIDDEFRIDRGRLVVRASITDDDFAWKRNVWRKVTPWAW